MKRIEMGTRGFGKLVKEQATKILGNVTFHKVSDIVLIKKNGVVIADFQRGHTSTDKGTIRIH